MSLAAYSDPESWASQSTSCRLALRKSLVPPLANARLLFPSPHCLQNSISCRPGRKLPGWRLCNCSAGGESVIKGRVSSPRVFLIRSPKVSLRVPPRPSFLYPHTGFGWSKVKPKICILLSFREANSPFHCGPGRCPQKPFHCDAFSHFIVALRGTRNCSEHHLSTTGLENSHEISPASRNRNSELRSRPIPCTHFPPTDLMPEALPHHFQGNVVLYGHKI